MKQLYEKQEIAQLLSKFMAGETSVAEEEVLAQYFRTHEVDEEWAGRGAGAVFPYPRSR